MSVIVDPGSARRGRSASRPPGRARHAAAIRRPGRPTSTSTAARRSRSSRCTSCRCSPSSPASPGQAVWLAVALYFVRMVAITGGYHRYFSHRSYRLGRVPQFVLAFVGTTAAQKGPLWWAAHHRAHHKYSDTERDIHSPIRGFWWSHVGWILCDKYNKTDTDAIKDFTKYPELVWLDKHDWVAPVDARRRVLPLRRMERAAHRLLRLDDRAVARDVLRELARARVRPARVRDHRHEPELGDRRAHHERRGLAQQPPPLPVGGPPGLPLVAGRRHLLRAAALQLRRHRPRHPARCPAAVRDEARAARRSGREPVPPRRPRITGHDETQARGTARVGRGRRRGARRRAGAVEVAVDRQPGAARTPDHGRHPRRRRAAAAAGTATDGIPLKYPRPPRGATHCAHGAGPTSFVSGCGARRGQDVRDAQRGPAPPRPGHRRRVGIVETHGRARTAEQLGDLEVVPRRKIEYRGHRVRGDGRRRGARPAPRRRARRRARAHQHSRARRNEKRWQDVEQLLDAGIDVISTLNIQHLESVNDVVERITGVKQRETIPDGDRAARRPDRARRHDARGAAPPHGARQRLQVGPHRRRARELLPARQPRRAARARAAVARRPRRRGPRELPRAPQHHRAVGDARAGARRDHGRARAPRR